MLVLLHGRYIQLRSVRSTYLDTHDISFLFPINSLGITFFNLSRIRSIDIEYIIQELKCFECTNTECAYLRL
jgi:hypothetical protein